MRYSIILHILMFAFCIPTLSKRFRSKHSQHISAYLCHKQCIVNLLISTHMYCIILHNNTIICTEFRKFKSIILKQTMWYTFFINMLEHMVYLFGKTSMDFAWIFLAKSKNNPKTSNKK